MQDLDIEQVLKTAGAREKPPAEVERAVRDGLRAEWRAMVGERRARQRRRAGFALAAGLVAAAIGAWMAIPRPGDSADRVGRIVAASDGLQLKSGWLGGFERAAAGRHLKPGDVLESAPAGRGTLALAGGVSARLDGRTRVTLASAGELILDRGALYIDAGPAPHAPSPLEVQTPSGTVRHVGTQYEIRLVGSGVRLRVREGRVEWTSPAGEVARGQVGEQLTIASDGSIAREPTAIYGESWHWVEAATPGLEIEGLRLADFMDWVAREMGRELRYQHPETEREAQAIILHGSVRGLTPQQAMAAVLATTRVRAELVEGLILVEGEGPEAGSTD